jgi:hypothetical protein
MATRRSDLVPDSLYGFCKPFFDSGEGQIFGLATRHESLRDGMAIAHVSRFFPLPAYQSIVVEPALPTALPRENIILVGRAEMFLKKDPLEGRASPEILGEKLAERLSQMASKSCFKFEGSVPSKRRVVNSVTHKSYKPAMKPGATREIDYGVIRRMFPTPYRNTITLEGGHRVGTLGVTKVLTSKILMDAIWGVVNTLKAFEDSHLLEILVETTFDRSQNNGVYSLEAIAVRPLAVVCDKRWIHTLNIGERWTDQLPWDIHLWVRGEEPPHKVVGPAPNYPVPRLEVRADLSGTAVKTRKLARKLFAEPGRRQPVVSDADRRELLERLTDRVDLFDLELAYSSNNIGRATMLPEGRGGNKRLYKQFILHLALCRVLGLTFQREEQAIRRLFPDFKTGASGRSFTSQFSAAVTGKIRRGFLRLFGPANDPTEYVALEFNGSPPSYELRLIRLTLVLKLRL